MSKYLSLFAKRLNIFLKELEINEYDLARSTGIHRPQITNLANGKGNPTIETLEKICIAVERPMADFFKEEILLTSVVVPKDILDSLKDADETQLNGVRGALGIPQKPKTKKSQEEVG